MHTVTSPLSVSAHSDIALMEAVAGFFGRLEFMTLGEAAFTKTSEFARQARGIVGKALNEKQSMSCAPAESNRQKEWLRPGATDHNADETPTGLSAQSTALDPVPTTFSGPSRQNDMNCYSSQAADPIARGSGSVCDSPGFGDSFSTLPHHMAGSIDLSFVNLPVGYLPDEWLAATSLDVA